MERVPEPELMDDPAQALAYAAADFAASNDRFVADFVAMFPDLTSGCIGDLGCGDADVTVRLASKLRDATIVGVDGAEAMLEHGRARVAHHRVGTRVALELRRLPDAELTDRFDAVVSNSVLHHLGDPTVFWQQVMAAAKPRAPVYVMDLRRPETESQLAGLVAEYARGAPNVLRWDFSNSLRAAFTVDEVRAQVADTDLVVEAVDDRYVRITGRAPA